MAGRQLGVQTRNSELYVCASGCRRPVRELLQRLEQMGGMSVRVEADARKLESDGSAGEVRRI